MLGRIILHFRHAASFRKIQPYNLTIVGCSISDVPFLFHDKYLTLWSIVLRYKLAASFWQIRTFRFT